MKHQFDPTIMTNFSRVSTGFYKSLATTHLEKDGEIDDEVCVTAYVRKMNWDGPEKWSVEVYRDGNDFSPHGLVACGDCPAKTYREGKEMAYEIVKKGFHWNPSLGCYCGN